MGLPHPPGQGALSQDCGLAVPWVCSAGPVSPQGVYSTFVYSYAVEKPLSVGHKVAGYLPSLFWGFITLGHLISIPISSKMKPATMVCINVVSGLLSLLGDVENHSLLALPLRPDFCSGWSSATEVDCRSRGRGGVLGKKGCCGPGGVPSPLWGPDFALINGRGWGR